MRRTRWAGLVLVVVLGLGGLSACGDDDGADVRETGEDGSGGSGSGSGSGTDSGSSGETETTETTEVTGADDGGEAATGVEGYCDAVLRYVELLGEATADPTSAGAELQEAADAFAEASLGLGELSAEDQARFDECAQEAADAIAALGG